MVLPPVTDTQSDDGDVPGDSGDTADTGAADGEEDPEVLAVEHRLQANGYSRWFATIRWQGHCEFGHQDSDVPVFGLDEHGAQLNEHARNEARKLIEQNEKGRLAVKKVT